LAEVVTVCVTSLSAASFIEDFLTEVFGQHCSSQSDDRDLDIIGWVLIYEVRVRKLQASLSLLKGLPSMLWGNLYFIEMRMMEVSLTY